MTFVCNHDMHSLLPLNNTSMGNNIISHPIMPFCIVKNTLFAPSPHPTPKNKISIVFNFS